MKRRAFLSLSALLLPEVWAQSVKISARAIDKSTIIVGNNNSIETTHQLDLQLPSAGITIDLGLAPWDDPDVQELLGWDQSPDFEYSISQDSNGYRIVPSGKYFTSYFSNRRVEALQYGFYYAPTFHVVPPTLDLRILNNSNRTITIKKLSLDVGESQTENRPIPVMISASDEFARLLVVNEGNHRVDKLVIRCNVYPTREDAERDDGEELNYSFESSNVSEVFRIDFREILAANGVDVKFLEHTFDTEPQIYPDQDRRKFRAALGVYMFTGVDYSSGRRLSIDEDDQDWSRVQFEAHVAGRLEATSIIDAQSHSTSFPFLAPIPLTAPSGLGAGLPALEAFQVELPSDRRKYQVQMPVSSYLKPFEVERLLFRVYSELSSWHRFTLRAELDDGLSLATKRVELFILNPRSTRLNADEES